MIDKWEWGAMRLGPGISRDWEAPSQRTVLRMPSEVKLTLASQAAPWLHLQANAKAIAEPMSSRCSWREVCWQGWAIALTRPMGGDQPMAGKRRRRKKTTNWT